MSRPALTELNVLGLIPARGGSKGLPGKNIMMLAGKPLLAYSITQGEESRYINRIVCTTDDPEIAEVAREHGAETPFLRPPELATDDASDAGFTVHAIEWLRDNDSWMADIVFLLRPTSPTRPVDHMDRALEMLYASPDAHSIVSVIEADKTPYKMFQQSDGKFLKPILAGPILEQQNSARQLFPPVYVQNGYVHAVWADVAVRDHSVFSYKVLPYHMASEPMMDIDSEHDVPAIEAFLARKARPDRETR